jgi:thymidine phosphorylase
MNQVLGRSAGNAVEVAESIDLLTSGAGDARLIAVTLALAAELLHLGGLAPSVEAGWDQARRALESGAAAERFARMVAALGGPADLLDRPAHYLPAAPVTLEVRPEQPGVVAAVDVRAVGLAILRLGGGRTRPDQGVDHAVGLTRIAGLGDAVEPDGAPLALIHARSEPDAAAAVLDIRRAYRLAAPGAAIAVGSPLIAGRIAP